MEKCLGNGANLVIVSKPGAGTVIGIVELLKAKPDGYTLGQLTLPAYVSGAARQAPAFGTPAASPTSAASLAPVRR